MQRFLLQHKWAKKGASRQCSQEIYWQRPVDISSLVRSRILSCCLSADEVLGTDMTQQNACTANVLGSLQEYSSSSLKDGQASSIWTVP